MPSAPSITTPPDAFVAVGPFFCKTRPRLEVPVSGRPCPAIQVAVMMPVPSGSKTNTFALSEEPASANAAGRMLTMHTKATSTTRLILFPPHAQELELILLVQ